MILTFSNMFFSNFLYILIYYHLFSKYDILKISYYKFKQLIFYIPSKVYIPLKLKFNLIN